MSKGDETRERIVAHAFRKASTDGLEGLSIGALATELGLSKSGLFAHFGSKEDLQIAVLAAASARYEAVVFTPSLRAARGLSRLRRWFDLWLQWLRDPAIPGGCLFVVAAVELDDRDGRARQTLVEMQAGLLRALARAAAMAVETGELDEGLDCEQFAFEVFAIILGCHHARRLMHDPHAEKRAHRAFDRLIASARAKKR